MIRICIISLIGNILDRTETLLVNLGKPIAKALGRRSIETEADPRLLPPCICGAPQALHQCISKPAALLSGMALPGHQLCHLIQADIAEGNSGISVVQQLVDLLSLIQSRNRSILPVNRTDVTGNPLQGTVTAHQRLKAQGEPLLQYLPEVLHIPFGQYTDLGKVQTDNPLIKTSLKFISAVLILPGSEKAAASHAAVYIPLIILPHLLCRNIIRIHPLRRALHGKSCNIIIFSAL